MTNPGSRLGLGALFGSGAAEGCADPNVTARAFATVALAVDAGMRSVDVPSYQAETIETVLGQVMPTRADLRLTLKADPAAKDEDALEQAARASLARVGRDCAQALMVTQGSILLQPQGLSLWRRMQQLKDAGLFAQIGVCACFCDDPLRLARRFRPDVMQLPASILDQRLIVDGSLTAIADLGVEIQLRATPLQDSLRIVPGEPVESAGLTPDLARVRRLFAEAGTDPLHAGVAFALSRAEASTVIVNAASPARLQTVLAAAAAPPPTLDWAALALAAPCSVMPSRRAPAA